MRTSRLRIHRRIARTFVALTAGWCALALAASSGAAPVPYSDRNANLWGVDGPVYAMVTVGDTVIVGGSFANQVAPDGRRVARRNVAAFRLSTGTPVETFRADADAEVRALATDGTRVFVGGWFGSINGQRRLRLATVDALTGAVAPSRTDVADGGVLALHHTNGVLYAGGTFTSALGGQASRFLAINLDTGQRTATAAGFDGAVNAITSAAGGTRILVGGAFGHAGLQTRRFLAEISPSGLAAPVTFAVNQPVLSLSTDTPGTTVYAGIAGAGVGSNRAVALNASTGSVRWQQVADGDVQAVRLLGDNLYFGFHESFNGDTSLRLLAADAATGAIESDYRVPVDGFWGVYAIDGDANRLIVGGNLTAQRTGTRNLLIFPLGPQPGVPYVATGTIWRWSAPDTTPIDTWAAPGFDDGAWAAGPSQLGFGDGDERTVVAARTASMRFRTTFDVAALPTGLKLSLVIDDGAAVYLNGVEITRDNLPAGPLTAATLATINRNGLDESTWRTVTVPVSALRIGRNVLAVSVHQQCVCSSDLSLDARLVPYTDRPAPPMPPAPVPTTLVAAGSTWRWSTADTTPIATWADPGYTDTGWSSGAAQLGFGDADERTLLPWGTASYRFRRAFEVPAAAPTSVTLRLLADDGAAVFINGVEVLRDNLPAGPLTNTTLAASNRSGAAESAWRSFTVPARLLRPGATNTIAVSVHQDCVCSSDLSLDVEITAS